MHVDAASLKRNTFLEFFMWLYVSVCADENEKWGLGRTGLCGGQAVPGHSFSLAPCLINGPRSYTLLHHRVCHSLIM